MRRLLLGLLFLFFQVGSRCWAEGVIAGTIVENESSPTRSAANTTWSQGLALGVNGPIPLIVVDQFGYPTKASKIAVIRDPKVGYDNAAHFTPGSTYALVDQSSGKITKQGQPTPWNGGATDSVSGDKVWWFDFSDVTIPGTYSVVDVDKGLRSPNSKSMIGFTEMS